MRRTIFLSFFSLILFSSFFVTPVSAAENFKFPVNNCSVPLEDGEYRLPDPSFLGFPRGYASDALIFDMIDIAQKSIYSVNLTNVKSYILGIYQGDYYIYVSPFFEKGLGSTRVRYSHSFKFDFNSRNLELVTPGGFYDNARNPFSVISFNNIGGESVQTGVVSQVYEPCGVVQGVPDFELYLFGDGVRPPYDATEVVINRLEGLVVVLLASYLSYVIVGRPLLSGLAGVLSND